MSERRHIVKNKLPITVVVMICLIGIMVFENSQIVYGGYDQQLLLAVRHLIEAKDLSAQGTIIIGGQWQEGTLLNQSVSQKVNWNDNQNDSQKAIELKLYYEGKIEASNSPVIFDIFMMMGNKKMDEPLGRMIFDGGLCSFDLLGGKELISIPLTLDSFGLGLNDMKVQSEEVDFQELIGKMIDEEEIVIDEKIIHDPREGYRQMKIKVTSYTYSNDYLKVMAYVDGSAKILQMDVSYYEGNIDLDSNAVGGKNGDIDTDVDTEIDTHGDVPSKRVDVRSVFAYYVDGGH